MGCNDFLITIKCDDVHATTYWNDIQNKPDVVTKDEIPDTSNFVNLTDDQTIHGVKNFDGIIQYYGQDLDGRYMGSGQLFKSINGESILGDGNIEISGGSGNIDTSNLVTRDEMNNYPNRNNWEDIYGQWSFQNGIYEYGTPLSERYMFNQSFKTINGESILGDGNIEISGGSGGGDVPSSGTVLNVKNGSGWSIQFISSFDYSGLQSCGNVDSQCLYVITD
jgi:hypothetical protein